MPTPTVPQARFLASAAYASLELQMVGQLFAGKTYFELSPDQRRILSNETDNLLLRSRWRIESRTFAEHFAIVQFGVEVAPPETVLGEAPRPQPQPGQASTGQYL
jgi:hypothetical protein